ncbi:magnesium transporter [Patescibacteria group bacterium]|nr:magnesium transporter [Patescibacteria group bacterium]
MNEVKRLNNFRKLPVNRQGFLLLEFSRHLQNKILSQLETEEIINLLRYLDLKMVVDLLQCLNEKDSQEITQKLNDDIKKKVEFLLKFDRKTAAGLMNLDYVEVDKNLTIREVLKVVQGYEKKTKKFPEILVVDNGFLLGELEARSLFISPNNKITNYIKKVPSVKYNEKEKVVINIFKKNPHNQIVVLDEDKSIIGVIYSDDILKLIKKETGKDLYSFAGLRKEEKIDDSFLVKVKNRYKWLIVNLGTAFLAASVVSLFEPTISKFVLLAIYMPIMAGMGGNAGTQTLVVVVRGLALQEINSKMARKIILNEMATGAINGIINGSIVALVAILFNKNPLLGLILGVSMFTNLIIAGLFGTIIPLTMKKLGKDPASSAAVFITTATDISGFFIFLGLATILL